uniref:Peroxisomal membrane protein n=1 Tax=Ogataea thermomethanolica (nom. inval.) TaxID=310468 RepID=A0A7R6ZU17_9ASCO|nr:peroxisomal membrane protein [Ogataea thermomethanolica (nom. inval.)]
MSAEKSPKQYSDDDLDDLDDLLDDFDDEILSKPPGATLNESSEQRSDQPEDLEVDDQELFGNLLKEIGTKDPELSKNLSNFLEDLSAPSQGASSTSSAQPTAKNNFQDVISETINRLKESGEQVDKSIKEEDGNDELLTSLLKSLDLNIDLKGLEGQNGGIDDVSNLLVEMLEKLSSKNVLYEPLNDLYQKFPSWLEKPENQQDKNYSVYQSQYTVIKDIIQTFNLPDYDEPQNKEFVNKKLEELQELGMPPKELLNEDLKFLNFGGNSEIELDDNDIPEEINKELEETCKQT